MAAMPTPAATAAGSRTRLRPGALSVSKLASFCTNASVPERVSGHLCSETHPFCALYGVDFCGYTLYIRAQNDTSKVVLLVSRGWPGGGTWRRGLPRSASKRTWTRSRWLSARATGVLADHVVLVREAAFWGRFPAPKLHGKPKAAPMRRSHPKRSEGSKRSGEAASWPLDGVSAAWPRGPARFRPFQRPERIDFIHTAALVEAFLRATQWRVRSHGDRQADRVHQLQPQG